MTAYKRLEQQAFHLAEERSPDLGGHPAYQLDPQWNLVSWMPAEGTS